VQFGAEWGREDFPIRRNRLAPCCKSEGIGELLPGGSLREDGRKRLCKRGIVRHSREKRCKSRVDIGNERTQRLLPVYRSPEIALETIMKRGRDFPRMARSGREPEQDRSRGDDMLLKRTQAPGLGLYKAAGLAEPGLKEFMSALGIAEAVDTHPHDDLKLHREKSPDHARLVLRVLDQASHLALKIG